LAVLGLLIGVAVLLFRGNTIRWLPVATPVLAVALTTVGGFAWSYLTEDRARQLLFKALSQNLSPELAARVASEPEWLNRLGGDRREMTVMFTDIAGFTDLSEKMEVEKLTELMNFYLEEMSNIVLNEQAYLDKYIGDAIMSFWNGVIDQPEHAALACRTALDMQRREREMQPELAARGANGLLTRMGINTGPMAIGNMGSSRKFAFTVLGDSVNLGSRLEGANKLYGSQILLSQTTADRIRGKFVIRQLDLLRVKGKKQPMAVYELMAEGSADAEQAERVSGYEQALALYQKQDWDAAEKILSGLIEKHSSDAPAASLRTRVQKLRHDPPGAGWDGVYVAKDK
jgi:adenylate cyclase